jgi:DNA mismatch endonuclease (patch repair protein)
MKGNRSSGTKPERILSHLLRKRLTDSGLPGHPDFVYGRAKLAIFVHGCWWHGCPEHYVPPRTHRSYWRRKLERNVERDRFNREDLESMGWKVVEVWEHEVRGDPKRVANRIMESATMSLR